MAGEKEAFLSRWSRLKREQLEQKPLAKQDDTPPPVVPPVDSLTPESDFSAFMNPKVKDELRRVALKKLFSDPHFNLPDPFEAYSGDWTGGEPIPPELLATLNQARSVLLTPEEKKALEQREAAEKQAEKQEAAEKQAEKQEAAEKQAEKQEAAAQQEVQEGEPKPDEPGRQDT